MIDVLPVNVGERDRIFLWTTELGVVLMTCNWNRFSEEEVEVIYQLTAFCTVISLRNFFNESVVSY